MRHGEPGRAREPAPDAWRLEVDVERCVASGICVSAEPGYFSLGDDAAHVLRAVVPPDPALVALVDACPSRAIGIHTADDAETASPVGEEGSCGLATGTVPTSMLPELGVLADVPRPRQDN